MPQKKAVRKSDKGSSGSALAKVNELLTPAAGRIFESDVRVRSVGVGLHESGGYTFVAVRNAKAIVPQSAAMASLPHHEQIPITYIDAERDPEGLLRVPHSGPGSPSASSMIPEQSRHRPLVCGLQVENFDDDTRTGEIAKGLIIIGTLGCFVKLANGKTAILSNNHVLAGENRGVRGKDRILQPGTGVFSAADHISTLTDYVAVQPSPAGATVASGKVVFNDVDAAVAALQPGVAFQQKYLPSRKPRSPNGVAQAQLGDKVHKVGRTTGLTFGTVAQVSTIVGPIPYAPGPCWFRQTLVIEGDNGSTFSDHGDSGSAIVRDDGKMVGLLFAGNGQETYACAIDLVLKSLKCGLA